MKQGKKGILRTAAALLALCMTAVSAPTAAFAEKNYRPTLDDVFMLRDALVNPMLGQELRTEWDLDANGVINAADLSLMKRFVMDPPQIEEKAVMLVYMCGSDLESEASEATEDIIEMALADLTEDLEVVVLTGGASKWNNAVVNANGNYYLTITTDDLDVTQMDGGLHYMNDGSTLSTFIKEATAAHPADHYGLVMWDHGSGPIYGCCFDELSENSLSLQDMYAALADADVHFDWIGFDCCLMGNLETAYALRKYADYMVGSEESESGIGWSYTNFLSAWAAEPSMETSELVKLIVDEMVEANKRLQTDYATLAAYDLRYAAPLMESVCLYMNDVYSAYKKQGVSAFKGQRSQVLDFGEGEYDVADLASLVTTLPMQNSAAVLGAIQDMVIYNRTYQIDNTCGVTLWFPENYPQDAVLLSTVFGGVEISSQYITQMREMSNSMMRSNGIFSAGSSRCRTAAEVFALQKPAQRELPAAVIAALEAFPVGAAHLGS